MFEFFYDLFGTSPKIRNGAAPVLLVIWLIVAGFMLREIYWTVKYRSNGSREAMKQHIYYHHNKGILTYAWEQETKGFAWWLVPVYGLICGFLAPTAAMPLVVPIGCIALMCFIMISVENEVIGRDLAQVAWLKHRAAVDGNSAQEASQSWGKADEDDSFFDFKKTAEDYFNDPNTYTKANARAEAKARSASKKAAPRGFENRHASDAKLWAIVDDPSATDAERQAAFSKVLKAQAKRSGHFEVDPTKLLEWKSK